MFFAILLAAGVLSNNGKLLNKFEKLLRGLSLTAATLAILYLVSMLIEIGAKEVTVMGMIGFALLCIIILALANLMHYATVKYADAKKSAAIAEYKLHLVKKGNKYEDVEKRSSDFSTYLGFQHEAERWEKSRDT